MKKLFEELTVQEGAIILGIDDSTLNRWLNEKKAPYSFKGIRRIVKRSVVDKIGMAMSRYGSEWFKHTTWTPFDRFEFDTVPLDRVALSEPPFEPGQQLEIQANVSSKAKELAGIAKQLQRLNEQELALSVFLRAAEAM